MDTALVAFLEPTTNELLFIYVSLPNKDLEVVPTEAPQQTVLNFYSTVNRTFARTFRIKGWRYSAVAHAISTCNMRTEPYDVLRGFERSEPVPRKSVL